MSLLKVNEIQIFNGTTVTITATTTETSADLNVGADLDVTGALTLGTALAIAEGGTGATDAATARINLDVDQAGTDNSTDVSLVTTSHDYLSITGQAITLGPIDLAADVTGNLPYASISGTPTLGTAAAEDVGYFATAAQGTLADSAVQPGDDAADLGSGVAADGYVLTADGAGGAAWEAASAVSGAQTNTTNTFTSNQIISVADNTHAALRITQTGTGNALVVEDSANPDSTPFVVDTSGNVGIGTTSPSKPLQVRQTAAVSGLSQTDIRVTRNEYGADFSGYIDQGVGHGAIISTVNNGTPTERMRIDSSGNALIGYTSSNGSYKLQVNSQIFATSAIIATSDGRYKENVTSLDGALNLVTQLNPVQFTWKEHPVHEFDRTQPTVGFIAQEVQEVLKDTPYVNSIIKANECLVGEERDEEGNIITEGTIEEFLGIAEGNLIALLTKALQEANAKIDALETRIQALEV